MDRKTAIIYALAAVSKLPGKSGEDAVYILVQELKKESQ